MSANPEEVLAATTAAPPPASDERPEEPKGAESAPAVKDPDEKKPSEGFTKRIDELTRDYRETERRLQAAERREQALLDRLSRTETKPEPEVAFQPKTLADFGYDEAKFQSYLIDAVGTHAEKRAVAAAEKKLSEARREETAHMRWSDFAEREEAYAKDVPDYHEITRNERLPFHDGSPLLETVLESEKGPEIAYYLGKNLRLAEQIARLPPLQMAREIGRIEARLDVTKTPKVSEAPPPAPTLAAVENVVEKDPEKMSNQEWNKWRDRQLARKK